jgi:monoamine oxidase
MRTYFKNYHWYKDLVFYLNSRMSSTYDLIIVGGGVAGLRVGIETLKTKPRLRCCILEKYGYIGGRVNTFKKNIPKVGDVKWENGAGRIYFSHKKVLKLLQQYHLTFVPIPSETDYITDPTYSFKEPHATGNKFSDLINFYLTPIEQLPEDVLSTHTLKELLDKTLGAGVAKQFYIQFPYYSEIHTLRADLALKSFRGEMKSNDRFGVCAEGLSSLTSSMMEEFVSLGGTVIMDTEVYKVSNNSDNSVTLNCQIRNTVQKNTYVGKSVVLALHHNAVKDIEGASKISVLKHLEMTPLLRMYAVFPTRNKVSWFSGINKTVTNSPVRYIIPIDPQRGIIMISYTDGDDAKYWIKQDESAAEHGQENVKELVMAEIRKLFPERSIPDPIFFKQHPWYDGCTYWLPGMYNVEYESIMSLNPLPKAISNLFMCGESFAVEQCWIESALEQADKLLHLPKFRISLRR